MNDENIIVSTIEAISRRAMMCIEDIKMLERKTNEKRAELNFCTAELCFCISKLENCASESAKALKNIVELPDMEIGRRAGMYEAYLEYKRATQNKEGEGDGS